MWMKSNTEDSSCKPDPVTSSNNVVSVTIGNSNKPVCSETTDSFCCSLIRFWLKLYDKLLLSHNSMMACCGVLFSDKDLLMVSVI